MGKKNSVEKLEVEEIMIDDGAKEPRIEDELQKETHQGFDLTPLQESPNSGSFSKGYGPGEASCYCQKRRKNHYQKNDQRGTA